MKLSASSEYYVFAGDSSYSIYDGTTHPTTQKLCRDIFFDGDQRKHDPRASPSNSLILGPLGPDYSPGFPVNNNISQRTSYILRGSFITRLWSSARDLLHFIHLLLLKHNNKPEHIFIFTGLIISLRDSLISSKLLFLLRVGTDSNSAQA
jgi:hypothetical protein